MGRRFSGLFTGLFALLGAAFHLVFAVVPLVTAPPRDWVSAVALVYLDYPLFLFFRATAFCDPWLNDGRSVWLYCILGTVMYAAAGALVGCGIDTLRCRRRVST